MKKVDYYREYVYRSKSLKPSRLKERSPFNPEKYQPSPAAKKLADYRKEQSYTKSYRLLRANGFLDEKLVKEKLTVPAKFSFVEDYSGTYAFIKSFISSIYNINGNLNIDFSQCTHIDIAPLLIICTIIRDYIRFSNKVRKLLPGDIHDYAEVKYIPSKVYEVNRILYTLRILPSIERQPDDKFLDVSTVGMIAEKKTRSHYIENKKGPVCNKIRKYINSCVRKVGLELTSEGETAVDSLLSEVLNNAEDHSEIDEWYVAGVSLHTRDGDEITSQYDGVTEVRLVIMNLGFSVYEGFETSRIENHRVYDVMALFYDRATAGLPEDELANYTRENLFTLYALQEGVSRIKFMENFESRGNGTMNFIRAFLELGDYENSSSRAKPLMSLISGKTMVLCDTTYKPYKDNTVYKLSLNPENDLSKLPDPDHLRSLPSHFPGTILEARLFFNKNHFLQKNDCAATNEVD
jgi:hypothetical protein